MFQGTLISYKKFMEALVGLVAVVLISLAVSCYTKADEKLKKRILIFNGVIYAIFIILLFFLSSGSYIYFFYSPSLSSPFNF